MKSFKSFLIEGNNTAGADVNEVLLAVYIVGATFENGKIKGPTSKIDNVSTLEKKLNDKIPKVKDFEDQDGRAKVMAIESLKWAKSNGYTGNPVKVYWTARKGSLGDAVNQDVDSRKNPTDVLIEFPGKKFLGISAKSSRLGEIGFKNPGLGTIESTFKVKLDDNKNKVEQDFMAKYPELSKVNSKRLVQIKKGLDENGNLKYKAEADKLGQGVESGIRDQLFDIMSKLSQEKLFDHLLNDWLDATEVYPPYVKVTGHGTKEPYSVISENPKSNDKIKKLTLGPIILKKVANNSIGVFGGKSKIFGIRLKYADIRLASSMKLSGDPK